MTGATRGIGRAIARRLAAEGQEIVNLSRSLPKDGFPAASFAVDLGDPAATEQVLKQVVERYDIDNLVNNAAAINVSALDTLSYGGFQQLVEVNLRALLQCTQAVVPGMKKKKRGRIVCLGSRAALGKARRTTYSMTKAGVVGLSRSLALELAPFGITVNVVSPGPIETKMFRENSKPSDPDVIALTGSIPLGRMGQPEDVAAAVDFFLSDAAAFITGQNLYVCGGLSVGSASL
ncbi:MAG: SDR family oxidoreductase [Gammaproteobacteria bacterium]|nr:SDR family oxidoreductase [Gammaproteobacteria bacterium]